ncbi:PREDICTED: putative peptidyl-tRNA hydrolase PTRHD1 [Priapulus caudatus]|uniref:peptidyl-tRNA hydrolase n=1 Tax=Priapulus caudatus TaxID=37621 RepID=A0ABM1DU52_PRICU|nr:PREDICTED: putative peptidyl-tRNA hydrolase PTRHD1 [Priapulus caudatus]
MASTIVQYVVVRGDLISNLRWPTGAVIAQACHATTAALHLFRDNADTQRYTDDLDRMHKVVLTAKGEDDLLALAEALQRDAVLHKLWTEQPENIPTCLATKPYEKATVEKYFKKFKLFK